MTGFLATTVSQGDPLYAHGVGWIVVLIAAIKVLVAFGALMGSVTLMIWFERKAISDMQSRIGPDRAGPWGILQSLADGIKLFFKEDLLPAKKEDADSYAWLLCHGFTSSWTAAPRASLVSPARAAYN